jgi:hypothetical protein
MADLFLLFRKAVEDTGNDGLGQPLGAVVRAHGFAERHEKADVGVLADEFRDDVAGVVAGEGRGCGEMKGNSVGLGERV